MGESGGTPDNETVLVIGAGIAGLCTALALAPTGRQVTLLERDPPAPPRDAGEDERGPRAYRADLVVDWAGKGDKAIEQLTEAGATVAEEGEPAGILYSTRHYRLLPGKSEPPRGRIPATGDLGFLKFGVF